MITYNRQLDQQKRQRRNSRRRRSKNSCLIAFQRVFVLACLIVAAAPALAQQQAAPPATEKWRPRDGLYAHPGAKFDADCDENGNVTIALSEKHISGNEWSCDITKLTDTAPGAIRLDMTCSDYNLAIHLKLPEDRNFKEAMYLRKIDEQSMLLRKSINGKLTDPAWHAAYCPEAIQRSYREQIAKELEEAAVKAGWERKAAEERKAIEARKAALEQSQPKVEK
jgi:hypothetical protein